MYKLIWENTLESCMSDATFYSICASITAFQNNEFKYISEILDFPGWRIVKNKQADNDKYYTYLQTLIENSQIAYKKIVSKANIKNTKLHYTEARLVQLLEEKGIGRPSTFSSLVDKIQEREYVKKDNIKGREIVCKDYELEGLDIFEEEVKREFGNEKNKLVIQPLGIMVIEFLDKYFSEIFNYEYTKNMEDDLDIIAQGKKVWYNLCGSAYEELNNLIKSTSGEKKKEIKIDENHTLVFGRKGPVIKSKDETNKTVFKNVKKDIDMFKIDSYKLEDLVDEERIDEKFLGMYDNNKLYVKKGRFGLYALWGENTKSLKGMFGNRPLENLTYDEIVKLIEEEGGPGCIRKISNTLSIRNGKYGDYIFYKNPSKKKPDFLKLKTFNDDYKTCDIQILQDWIFENYKVK